MHVYLLVGQWLSCNWLGVLRVEIQTILNSTSLPAMSTVIVVVAHLMMTATTCTCTATSLIHHIHLLLMIVGIAWMMVVVVLGLS